MRKSPMLSSSLSVLRVHISNLWTIWPPIAAPSSTCGPSSRKRRASCRRPCRRNSGPGRAGPGCADRCCRSRSARAEVPSTCFLFLGGRSLAFVLVFIALSLSLPAVSFAASLPFDCASALHSSRSGGFLLVGGRGLVGLHFLLVALRSERRLQILAQHNHVAAAVTGTLN